MPPPTGILVLVISHSTALVTTVLRLVHRFQTRRLWWDDLWAFIALIFDSLVLTLFMVLPPYVYGKPYSIQQFSKLGILLSSTTALWSARLSVGVTITRLLTRGRLRTISIIMNFCFGFFCIFVVVYKMVVCSIYGKNLPYCPLPPLTTGLIELITDVIGDAWLLCSPCYMLINMKLSEQHKRLLLAIFACGLLTAGACLAHIVFLFKANPIWIGMTAHVQLGTSIVVCNILVLATYLYRVFWSVDGTHGTTTTTTTGQISSKKHTSGLQTTRGTEQSNATAANNDVTSSVILTDLGTNFNDTPQLTSNNTAGLNNGTSLQLNSGLQLSGDSQASQIISSFDFSSLKASSKGQTS